MRLPNVTARASLWRDIRTSGVCSNLSVAVGGNPTISGIGILACFAEIALFFGPAKLRLLPVGLTVMILLIIPAVSFFGSGLASVISSRVRTFHAAQSYSALILVFLWFGLIALLFLVSTLGLWAFAAAVAGLYAVDILLIVLSAITWRREEVMAHQ